MFIPQDYVLDYIPFGNANSNMCLQPQQIGRSDCRRPVYWGHHFKDSSWNRPFLMLQIVGDPSQKNRRHGVSGGFLPGDEGVLLPLDELASPYPQAFNVLG